MAVYTLLEQYDFTSKTIPSAPMRAATFPMPLRDSQKTEAGTAVTKGLAIQGSNVDSAKTALVRWIWESRYEEMERACSLVTAVRFLTAKNGVDYKFSLHFLPGLWYTAWTPSTANCLQSTLRLLVLCAGRWRISVSWRLYLPAGTYC